MILALPVICSINQHESHFTFYDNEFSDGEDVMQSCLSEADLDKNLKASTRELQKVNRTLTEGL